MSKQIIDPGNKLPDTSDVLEETFRAMVEGLTGLASSDKKEIIRSFGSILQRWRSLGLLDAFRIEWNRYREAGRIKDDYVAGDQHQECLQELLDFLDSDAPDKLRFDILKKILLVTATEVHSSRDDVLPQQYMRLARELSSGEALVLLTAYDLSETALGDQGPLPLQDWLKEIADASGLCHADLAAIHEEKLAARNLVTAKAYSGPTLVTRGKYNHLTELGYALCEFVSNYSET